MTPRGSRGYETGPHRRVLKAPSADAQILEGVHSLAPDQAPVVETAVPEGCPIDVPDRGPEPDGLLLGTGVIYLLGLSRNGWGNSFYAGAAQAGAHSWSAMFFGSSDAGNSITVDKPPASLWLMESVDAAVRAVQLVGARAAGADGRGDGRAALAAVQRALGPWPGLPAGWLFALTPVATLLFRYDNPDALMTLLVVAAATPRRGRSRTAGPAGPCSPADCSAWRSSPVAAGVPRAARSRLVLLVALPGSLAGG